ncbi:cationic amino acid transporter 2 isoform X1 [Agrilus planipennis]|uniref:Cationic amino acid transporter 2 isoform X1 n=2 Tax=Agrilus planipennis TaxID=224129 RepID=A0A7F5RJJ6_AGRPL|nr:cationic amino acid transporter 2 isoform X1 [Agrilus planipennis]
MKAMKFLSYLSRKKTPLVNQDSSLLARVLSVVDLTGLGVGSTLGLGVYVLAGSVAKTVAGPAVCLSFLVAAIASAFAGLCYAEFASRVPRAGSAYVYSYVTVGEFVAYIIGWNLILEYVIGSASVARGMSNYIDSLTNYQMKNYFSQVVPINVDFLADYPDILSFVLVVVITVLLAFGVKESSFLNNIFTVLNLVVIAIVIVAGSINADVKNWRISKDEIPEDLSSAAGEGGFLPFGVAGIMAGAARCFFGFVGFDAIATTGEEAKNPQRNIPIAIVISLTIIFFAYFGISVVLTLMWPYYDQDADAPFPYVFEQLGWTAIKWIVTTGAVFALCTSLLGAMFPLPRVLYAMASDGLLFFSLSKVHPKTQTPLLATIISGIFAGLMSMIFNLDQLVDMMSIGTLLAYTIVSVCVLVLRYEQITDYSHLKKDLEMKKQDVVLFDVFKQVFNLNNNKYPNEFSANIIKWSIVAFSVLSVVISLILFYGMTDSEFMKPQYIVPLVLLFIALIVCVIVIARQPTEDANLAFKVPWVPYIPCLSVFINLYLMVQLDLQTWIRFAVWLLIGFVIYFGYGITHSTEREIHELSEKKNSFAISANETEKPENDTYKKQTTAC